MNGSGDKGVIVRTPEPGMLNSMVFASAFELAALIASRRVQPPAANVHEPSSVSAVELTVRDKPSAVTQFENSDVLFDGSVAVAVIYGPSNEALGRFTLIGALPFASVVRNVKPTNFFPSPLPEASHEGLEKNSTRN